MHGNENQKHEIGIPEILCLHMKLPKTRSVRLCRQGCSRPRGAQRDEAMEGTGALIYLPTRQHKYFLYRQQSAPFVIGRAEAKVSTNKCR